MEFPNTTSTVTDLSGCDTANADARKDHERIPSQFLVKTEISEQPVASDESKLTAVRGAAFLLGASQSIGQEGAIGITTDERRSQSSASKAKGKHYVETGMARDVEVDAKRKTDEIGASEPMTQVSSQFSTVPDFVWSMPPPSTWLYHVIL
ncbi:hypothetical protein K525DRAFT_273493 [Schizophyllum commune Loenen D]|nr:hypothetical protein K525DRAFT_273493 [Schizophyllum commune Loenen D]